MVECLRSSQGTRAVSANRWLGCYEPRPSARLRLFCFPFAGGSASAYRGWSVGLPHDVEVCPIQLPGREDRFTEPAYRRIAELVPVLVDVLTPLLDVPFAFYGHSMGSLIAFELAHELRARGRPGPFALFPAAHQAPSIPHEEVVSELPEAELLAHVERMDNTAPLLEHPELLRLILPTLRRDFALCDTYVFVARAKLTSRIIAFGGQGDGVTHAALEAWAEQTEGPFEIEMLPGGHFFLTSSRSQLLAILSRALARFA
jgi:medium-chain acyl-[acyl-carrier-protein] hydrolase